MSAEPLILAETSWAGLSGLLPIGLLILVGLALWAAGRRVMRPAFALGGLVVGYLVGYSVAAAVALDMGDWVVGAAVGLVVASLAILIYRLAVTLVLAIVLAVAAPLAVMTAAEFQSAAADDEGLLALQEDDTDPVVDDDALAEDPGAWLTTSDDPPVDVEGGPDRDLAEQLVAAAPLAIPEFDLSPAAADQLVRAGSWVERMAESAAQEWREAPEALRPSILIASVCGALAGVILGTASAALSATIVSAFGGSLIMLTGGRAAIEIIGDGLESLIPTATSSMLLIWLVLAVVGLAIQWTLRSDPADKAA